MFTRWSMQLLYMHGTVSNGVLGVWRKMDSRQALKKLQDEELDILVMFSAFCASHGLKWFLESGTCLGALRHKGFIPWDDDIDIGMLRPDYDRMLTLAQNELPHGYSLHTFENTNGFPGFFAKIYKDDTVFETQETREAGCPQGIFIDIFPYDALQRKEDPGRHKQMSNAQKWKSISYLYHSKSIRVPHGGFLGAVEAFACNFAHYVVKFFFSREQIASGWERSICHGCESPDAEWAILMGQKIRAYSYSDLLPVSHALFCGCQFPVPNKPEVMLERLYGDWRSLPAPEDRKTHLPLRLVFSDGSSWTVGR